ncbi:DUF4383 domain-containing protein [Nocardioides anomalus]|uniref:DUF4383 domain-containing protein n=1 Tax=Nocardioides anomalus TaxID=2712223 RepID=A0A6G6WAB6_9ACTN|nr:DUF4383 domain-containing protein [Nocardioides anomalus]QIG41980.1 DUF4383 domain-containing protein [Nocardioides anomalus]
MSNQHGVNDGSIQVNTGGTPYDVGAAGFLRTVTGAYGLVFLIVGILGFVPGVTTHYGDLTFAGHTSGAELAGVFQVSVLHNLIHLAYGVVGLTLAARPRPAALYLLLGGVVYAVVWLYGVLVGDDSQANVVPLNSADDWLHLVLAVSMVALGVLGLRRLRHRGRGPSLA